MAVTWQPIETAPQGTVIVGDETAENIAVAHFNAGDWLLGPAKDGGGIFYVLDFTPSWWLPRDYPANPFRANFPEPST